MPGTTISGFGEPDDYQAALQVEGCFDLLVTGRGQFKAQLTRISLRRVELLAGEENLSRIALISPPQRLVRVMLPTQRAVSLYLGGIPFHPGELVTLCGGKRLHERTEGRSEWRTVWLPMNDLLTFGRAVIGPAFAVPPGVCRWRPTPAALRNLTHLHDDAVRTSRAQPRVAAGAAAAYGLEQQVFHTLIECMVNASPDTGATIRRHHDIMSRFEDLIRANPRQNYSSHGICTTLGVPERTLRTWCKTHLGMSMLRYLHLLRMQLARRALRGCSATIWMRGSP